MAWGKAFTDPRLDREVAMTKAEAPVFKGLMERLTCNQSQSTKKGLGLRFMISAMRQGWMKGHLFTP